MTLRTALTVPLVTALIGYVTNWLAVRMVYHPQRFIGIGPIGWQGIVHRYSEKFAQELASTIRSIVDPAEIVERIDLVRLSEALSRTAGEPTAGFVGYLVDSASPGAWSEADPERQVRAVELAETVVGRIAHDAQRIARENADGLIDIETLAVELLSGAESARLAHISRRLGAGELRFIERYGAVFGFCFGLLLLLVHAALGVWWLLPLIGGVVGATTNWLAILMIFRPLEPTRYFGLVRYQGLFPRRQQEIAREFAAVTADEVLTAEELLRRAVSSPAAAPILQVVFTTAVDDVARLLEVALGRPPTADECARANSALLTLPGAVGADTRRALLDNVDAEVALEGLMQERLATMPKVQFERLLRGMFEEDEPLLVAIGAVLGAAIGLVQATLLL